jgi:PPK2 family polyphosphate:nucleotide phosphotransferase
MEEQKYLAEPGKKIKLSDFPTGTDELKPDKKVLKERQTKDIEEISDLQYKLYAENRQSLLIILQGMDAAGKDGTIKHIMSGVNPQGVIVHSFKSPAGEELKHDYLWRHYQKLPEKGQIAVFNRSHYENVLIAKVHPDIVLSEGLPGVDSIEKVNDAFWKKRYRQINHFEETITDSGTQILKFMLHLSYKEQRKRFLKRIEEKEKHWKFSYDDIKERGYWKDYLQAYEDAINHTSTEYAPWYIIPADNKWYTRQTIARIVLGKLKQMNPSFPKISAKDAEMIQKAKYILEEEKAKDQKEPDSSTKLKTS